VLLFLRHSKLLGFVLVGCPCDRLVKTAAEAADETKGLDTESLVLGEVPNAMESDAELQV
jgi:hypothetical protein